MQLNSHACTTAWLVQDEAGQIIIVHQVFRSIGGQFSVFTTFQSIYCMCVSATWSTYSSIYPYFDWPFMVRSSYRIEFMSLYTGSHVTTEFMSLYWWSFNFVDIPIRSSCLSCSPSRVCSRPVRLRKVQSTAYCTAQDASYPFWACVRAPAAVGRCPLLGWFRRSAPCAVFSQISGTTSWFGKQSCNNYALAMLAEFLIRFSS